MLVVHAGLAAESSNHEVDQKQELEDPDEKVEDHKSYPVSLHTFTNFSSRIVSRLALKMQKVDVEKIKFFSLDCSYL